MPYRFAALVLASALSFSPVAARAQMAIMPGEAIVPADEVREIARNNGLARIESIELNQNTGRWEVDGSDAVDREIEMDIDARTGTVLKIER